MTTKQTHNALTSQEVIDRYFLEHRAKLIDIAAFLDRIDRANDTRAAEGDYRMAALFKALDVLSDGRANRAGRILTIFSEASTELLQSAEGIKSATGAAKEENNS
ncbi:MAG: hypothetical protein H8E73_00905 [Planctomycetes bacterium]|nr:hypothetical protein [Planctomycetota bacterium]MBL7187507.1 hypothetical protein [Phycisphaerae bacterium]